MQSGQGHSSIAAILAPTPPITLAIPPRAVIDPSIRDGIETFGYLGTPVVLHCLPASQYGQTAKTSHTLALYTTHRVPERSSYLDVAPCALSSYLSDQPQHQHQPGPAPWPHDLGARADDLSPRYSFAANWNDRSPESQTLFRGIQMFLVSRLLCQSRYSMVFSPRPRDDIPAGATGPPDKLTGRGLDPALIRLLYSSDHGEGIGCRKE
ncbi:hypothetical protein N7523_009042 [Penicillium sp. IBT 18751x]|nr:hypothetical protein N7523_009042 [Penicillium sp. IBT 18751x]